MAGQSFFPTRTAFIGALRAISIGFRNALDFRPKPEQLIEIDAPPPAPPKVRKYRPPSDPGRLMRNRTPVLPRQANLFVHDWFRREALGSSRRRDYKSLTVEEKDKIKATMEAHRAKLR